MSRLRGKFRGVPLANPPQTDQERAWAESWGFRQLPTGKWVYPETQYRIPTEVQKKRPLVGRCKACRDEFRTDKKGEHYCRSCRGIITQKQNELEAIVRSVPDPSAALRAIERELRCPYRHCQWAANDGRHKPNNTKHLLAYLPEWIAKAHGHFMRHVFWNRFPFSKRFFPHELLNDQSREAMEKFKEEYDFNYRRKFRMKLDQLARRVKFQVDYSPFAEINLNQDNQKAEIPIPGSRRPGDPQEI